MKRGRLFWGKTVKYNCLKTKTP